MGGAAQISGQHNLMHVILNEAQRSEESHSCIAGILRFAQNDSTFLQVTQEVDIQPPWGADPLLFDI